MELQQEGKIRQWGMSNLDVDDMERILSLPHGKDCAADQVLYNLKDLGRDSPQARCYSHA